MTESSENPRTPPGSREPEGMEDDPAQASSPGAGHPTLGAGGPEEAAGESGGEDAAGTSSMSSTPHISTEDQGGDLTGPTPGDTQGTPPKEE